LAKPFLVFPVIPGKKRQSNPKKKNRWGRDMWRNPCSIPEIHPSLLSNTYFSERGYEEH
jgi:hypothetical protein